MGFLPVSTLPSPWPRLGPTILELNPHPLSGSQGQLAASMLTLLTVHFSYLHPNVNKNKMFWAGNSYQSLNDWQDAEFTDLQWKGYMPLKHFHLLASEEAKGACIRVLKDMSRRVIFTPSCSCPNHLAWGKPLPHRMNSHYHLERQSWSHSIWWRCM